MKPDNPENVLFTRSHRGHTLHHNGVFSPDGQWVVFDGRNDDTKIGETADIGLVNVTTAEEILIYSTENSSVFGPGVGAASFSPTDDFVIFIHGLPDANQEKPYGMSRRTGVGIDIRRPFEPVMMDARDMTPPYTPGSLRGGTHSHMWSGDGEMLSFTYNDELVDPDLRVVGVMVPYTPGVKVDSAPGNNSGKYYSAVVTKVVREPAPGSDEISKAFDECWVGSSGYTNARGEKIPYAIAFQGNTIGANGQVITEVFVVDIDPQRVVADAEAVGEPGTRPHVPQGMQQRRITFSEKGLSDTRHWLRSSPDGRYIYALAKDENNLDQIIQITVSTGEIFYLTHNRFSIDFAFNVSHDGKRICYVGQNQVHILDIEKEESVVMSRGTGGKIVGAPSFSPKDDLIIYNQYIKNEKGEDFLQIRKINLGK